MVAHEDATVAMEIPIEKQASRNSKKCVIIQNHVPENSTSDKSECNVEFPTDTSCQISENTSQNLPRKSLRKTGLNAHLPTSSIKSEDSMDNIVTEIGKADLEELRSVYKKCKEVINKIETKYGHLLNIKAETNRKSLKRCFNDEVEEECQCSVKKKIIFNDNGEQEIIDTDKQGHICLSKLQQSPPESPFLQNIEIYYSENEDDIQLPDDLESLSKILRDPNIGVTYRNKVINKVKSLKQELLNDIKFNKHSLIEKLKTNPYEILDFKGTNLDSLPGYV